MASETHENIPEKFETDLLSPVLTKIGETEDYGVGEVLNFLNNENLDLELSQSSHDMVLSIISRLRQINSDTTSSQNELTDVFNQIINDIADIKTEIRSKIYRGIIDSPIRTFSSPVRQETVPIIPTSISPADEISSESGSIFDTPLVPWGDEVSEGAITPQVQRPITVVETVSHITESDIDTVLEMGTKLSTLSEYINSQYPGNTYYGIIASHTQGLATELTVDNPELKLSIPTYYNRISSEIIILQGILSQLNTNTDIAELSLENAQDGEGLNAYLRRLQSERASIITSTTQILADARTNIHTVFPRLLQGMNPGDVSSFDSYIGDALENIDTVGGVTNNDAIVSLGRGISLENSVDWDLSTLLIGSEHFLQFENFTLTDEDFSDIIMKMLKDQEGFRESMIAKYGAGFSDEGIVNLLLQDLALTSPRIDRETGEEIFTSINETLRANFSELQQQLGNGLSTFYINGTLVGPIVDESDANARDKHIVQMLYFYEGLLQDPNGAESILGPIGTTVSIINRFRLLGIPLAIDQVETDPWDEVAGLAVTAITLTAMVIGARHKRMAIPFTSIDIPRRYLLLSIPRLRGKGRAEYLRSPGGFSARYRELMRKERNSDGTVKEEVQTRLTALEEEFRKFSTSLTLEDLVKREDLIKNLIEYHKSINQGEIADKIKKISDEIKFYSNRNVFYSTLFTEYKNINGDRGFINKGFRTAGGILLTGPLATIEARTGSQQLNLFGIRSAIQGDGYVGNFEAYFDNLTATSYLNTIRGSSVIEESSKNNVEAADTIERAKDTGGMSNENIARAFEPINDAIKTIQNKVNATSGPIQAIYGDNFKTELQSLLDLNIGNEGAVKGLVPGNLVTLKDGVEELVSEIPLIERIHAGINTTEHQYLRDAIEPKVKEFIGEQGDNKIEKYADLIKTVDGVDGIILKLHGEIQGSPHENVFKTSLTQILTSGEAMESKCKFLKNSIPSLRSIYTSMRNIPGIVDETLVDLYSFLKNENRSTTDIEKIRKLFNDPYGGEFKNNIIYSDTNRLNTDFITNFINHRNDVDAVTGKKPEDITRERKRLVDEFLARDHTAIDPNPPVGPINPVDPIGPLRPDAEDEIIRKTGVELLSSDNHYIIMNDIMRDRFGVDLNEYLKDVLTAEYDDFDSAYQAATNELERGGYLIDDGSDSYKWAEPGDINTDDTKIDVDDTDVTDVDDGTERTPTPFERRIISEHIGDLNNPRNDFARSYRALLWELEMHPRGIEQGTINKIRSEVFDNNYRTPGEASGAINSILDTDYPGMSMRAGIPTSSYEIAELRFTLNVLDRAILLCELEGKRLKRDVASEIRRNIIEGNLGGNDIKNTLIDILKNSLGIDITEIPTTNSLISRHFDSRITGTPLTDDIRAEIERSYMDGVREGPSSRLSIGELIRNAVGR